MKDPNYPSEQPKDRVSDALTDRNSDPEAQAQDEPLKVHGDALLGVRGASVERGADQRASDSENQTGDRAGDRSDDGPPDGSRDEGF